MKFLVLAAIACVVCHMITKKWPWELWAASSRSNDQARARALLGVPRGASREQILEAHRREISRAHPDRGGSNEEAHKVNWARDVLLAGANNSISGGN